MGEIHKAQEIQGIGAQHFLALNEGSKIAGFMGFHPSGRAPGGGEESHVGVALLGLFDVGDEILLVPADGKILHFKIPVGLVVGIPA